MACELTAGYSKLNCAENGGIDEIIIYNLENRASYTLATGEITALALNTGKQAWQLTPDLESGTAGQTPTRSRENNSKMIPQTAMIMFKDDENPTVDLCEILLGGFFGVIVKKSDPDDNLYRHYGLINGMTVDTIEDTLGQLYEDLRGKTVNFVGKELAMAPSVDPAIIAGLLTPAP